MLINIEPSKTVYFISPFYPAWISLDGKQDTALQSVTQRRKSGTSVHRSLRVGHGIGRGLQNVGAGFCYKKKQIYIFVIFSTC